MKEVKACKTSDGKLFDNKKEAWKHQYNIDVRESLNKFGDKYFFSSMTVEDTIDIIIDNLEEFKKIL